MTKITTFIAAALIGLNVSAQKTTKVDIDASKPEGGSKPAEKKE